MKKQALYTNAAVQNLVKQYAEDQNSRIYVIGGCLLDGYILTAPGFKTVIIKDVYIDCWSSAQSIRMYNKTPAKYERVIDLLEEDMEEEAFNLFYNIRGAR